MSQAQLDSKLLEDNLNFWEDRYVKSKVEWHINDVNPILLKHLPTLTSNTGSVVSSPKIFIPLCGMTKDIPYLLSLGYDVFGVESVASAIDMLDKENSLNLKFDEASSLYHTEDMKLKIYCGDFFKCPIEKWGPFDYVWDRASLIAMDYALREEYVEVMKRSVGFGSGHKFAYLLQCVRYDKNVYPGPPRAVDLNDIKIYFEPWATVRELEKYIVPEDGPMRKVTGKIDWDLYEVVLLLTNKH